MKPYTKIVATLGPSTEEKSVIEDLVEAGMNVARLNFSHGNEDQFKKIVKHVRLAEKNTGKTVTIMQDLQGPKIRLGKLETPIKVKKNESITFDTKGIKGVPIPNCNMLSKVVKKGQSLLIEDGLLKTKIVSVEPGLIKVKALCSGTLRSNKGVNIPESLLPSGSLPTKKDLKNLTFGIKTLKVDAVALSFVERASDIIKLRKEILKLTKRPVQIIAKIERREALENLDEIIDAADVIMVARGDLGIETSPEEVPVIQRKILEQARRKAKPVIIATQILQSMIENPIATRAEISDAANAIFDHADAFMLSNESAVGKYPVKAVRTLTNVAKKTEAALFKEDDLSPTEWAFNAYNLEDESMALNACEIAEDLNVDSIIILTHSGYTARMILKHRPQTPVSVLTPSEPAIKALQFVWGAKNIELYKGAFDSKNAISHLKRCKRVRSGQKHIVITLGEKKRSLVVVNV